MNSNFLQEWTERQRAKARDLIDPEARLVCLQIIREAGQLLEAAGCAAVSISSEREGEDDEPGFEEVPKLRA